MLGNEKLAKNNTEKRDDRRVEGERDCPQGGRKASLRGRHLGQAQNEVREQALCITIQEKKIPVRGSS